MGITKKMTENRNRGRVRMRILILVIMVFLFTFPLMRPPLFFLTLLFSVFMYVALTQSWNLMGGYAGYASLGHVTFFSIGAYTTALFLNRLGVSPFVTAILGGIFAATVAALVGYPILRLKGAYFTISTLLLAAVAQLIFLNWEFVGASVGLWLKHLPLSMEMNRVLFYEVMLMVATLTTLLIRWVEKSKLGAGLVAIREDEDVAKMIGVNTPWIKMQAFVLGAFLAGVVGGINSYYMSYIHPDSTFSIHTSLLLLLMAFFGGTNTWTGPLVGAFILSIVNQLIVTFIGAEISRILYGLLLVVIIMFMPDGVIEYVKSRPFLRKYRPEYKNA